MKTIIHVNQHKIKKNNKDNTCEPVLTCKTYKSNIYGHRADILDDRGKVVASVVYRPEKPLSCGARVWIETQNQVNVINTLGKNSESLDISDFQWNDDLVMEFSKIATEGSYGDYSECKKLSEKIERFKALKLAENITNM